MHSQQHHTAAARFHYRARMFYRYPRKVHLLNAHRPPQGGELLSRGKGLGLNVNNPGLVTKIAPAR